MAYHGQDMAKKHLHAWYFWPGRDMVKTIREYWRGWSLILTSDLDLPLPENKTAYLLWQSSPGWIFQAVTSVLYRMNAYSYLGCLPSKWSFESSVVDF